ncbi:MAG: hypothetical protein N0E48_03065, partial [Candidatus Thiodiazotropha endolucinida]|nr:hypothetical protein [Candidatus Thiodiazotropha taylori]MCW4342343.1 hypothetical protein [Candidatus Thiodiazotropha endolucinida]
VNVHVDHIKPYEGKNAPESWLTDIDTSNVANDNPSISNGDLSDMVESEIPLPYESTNISNENPANADKMQRYEDESLDCSKQSNQPDNDKRPTTGLPTIRSRRERAVKPRQIWSPF